MDAMIHGMYKSKLLAVGPDAVAKVIVRSLTRRNPHARYVVPVMTRGLIGTRLMMPTRAWDTMLRTIVR